MNFAHRAKFAVLIGSLCLGLLASPAMNSAQAVGGSFCGQHLGTIGDLGCFSFDAGKVMNTGEGGMVLTNIEEYFKNAMGITSYKGNAHVIKLKAKEIASKYLKSQPIHKSQEVIKEIEDGTTYFQLKLLISEELIRALLSYGGEIEIIEPKELKTALIERISAMHKVYQLK